MTVSTHIPAVPVAPARGVLRPLGLDEVRKYAANMEYETARFYRKAAESARDVSLRGGAVSFLFDGIHAHDISQVLDEHAVCVRAGHHCAKPLMRVLGVPATTRASFYVYNDEADADALIDALARAEKFFAF